MKFLLLLSILLLASACNKTIEDPDQVDDSSSINASLDLDYSGIYNVFPISHDAVQVVINPINPGTNIYSYLVFKNGNFTAPVTTGLMSELKKDSNGKYNLIVRGLQAGETNTFSVRVYDVAKGTMEDNTKKLLATTFSDRRPIFNGIKSVKNVGGFLGNSALEVFWTPATPASAESIMDPNHISGYRIHWKKLGDNWQSMALSDRLISSYIINGLESNSLYYFYVSAIDSNSPKKEDENHVELSKATLSESLIVFDGIQTGSVPANMTGLNNINVTWNAGSGPFSYYRVFYTTNPLLSFGITPSSAVYFANPDVEYLDIFDTTKTYHSFYVTGQVTEYFVGVVACEGANCANFDATANFTLSVFTTPPVAPFMGLNQIDADIDTMTLKWLDLPDGNLGAYNGYKILAKKGLLGVPYELTLAPNPIIDDIYLESLPNGSARSTKVLNLTLGDEYCFNVQSRLTHSSGESLYPNNSWICRTAQVIPSTQPVLQHVSNNYCYNLTPSAFEVRWNSSSGNVSNYEIYFQSTPIDYGVSNPYALVPHNSSSTSFKYSFSGLPAGVTYHVGVRPIYTHATQGTFVGPGANLVSCSTPINKLIPGEWVSMISVGQKINGTNLLKVPEVFLEAGDSYLDGSVAKFAMPAEFSDVSTGLALATNSSKNDQGMVRLAWLDFEFEGSGGAFSLGQTDPLLGYDVYRQPYTAAHANSKPALNDSNWVMISNPNSPIKAKAFSVGPESFNMATFHDYTIPDDPNASSVAKAYWYKVVPVINHNELLLTNSLPLDVVVKVVVPPYNMASIHPWNVNRETCKRLKKPYNRNANYRCLYNGLLSRDPNNTGIKYYDFGGHLLVDRFEAGCNFSRLKCNYTETGGLSGDCIGIKKPTQKFGGGTIDTDTVWYKRIMTQGDTCQIYNSSDFVSLNLVNNPAPAITNNAGMPPLGDISKDKLAVVCENRGLEFEAVGSSRYPLSSRLPTKSEYVVINTPALETLSYRDVELGIESRGCSLASSAHTKSILSGYGLGVGLLDYSNYRYPVTTSGEVLAANRTNIGPYFATGSTGTGSTSMCVGRYGIQDSMGNAAEWTAETIGCVDESNCSLQSFDPHNLTSATEPIDNSGNSKITNFYDYSGQWRAVTNASTYFYYGYTFSYPNINGFTSGKFFSLTMGLPLSCSGGSFSACKENGVYTDDIRFSRSSTHPLSNQPNAYNFPFTGTDHAQSRIYFPFVTYAKSGDFVLSSPPNIYPKDTSSYGSGLAFAVGNFPCSDDNYAYGGAYCPQSHIINSRYSYTTTPGSVSTSMIGGRCASFIKEGSQGEFSW